jgi:hypothetical protein
MLTTFYLKSNRLKGKACYLASLSLITAIIVNPTPASAVQLLYSSPGNVSQIQEFVVDGITYDITFQYDSFVNIFGIPNSSNFNQPTFWRNSQTAQKVVDNIATLLNSQQPVPTKVNNYSSLLVPYEGNSTANGSGFIVSKIDNYITRWDNYRGESQDIFTQVDEPANYAIFSLQEPPQKVSEANLGADAMVAFLLGASTFKRYCEKQNRKGK